MATTVQRPPPSPSQDATGTGTAAHRWPWPSASTARSDHARHRAVAEVMSQQLRTIDPDAPYKEIVRALLEFRISALPVVGSEGTLLGVVSEADLLAKERDLDQPLLGALRPSWRAEHARAEAVVARELMTSPAVTIHFRASLAVAARTMAGLNVRRLCVVDDDGKLVGVVTRGDLLRPYGRVDSDLADEIRSGVLLEIMSLDPTKFTVLVEDGVAHISGELERRSEARLLEIFVNHVDGIVAIDLNVTWSFDDMHLPVRPNPPRV